METLACTIHLSTHVILQDVHLRVLQRNLTPFPITMVKSMWSQVACHINASRVVLF